MWPFPKSETRKLEERAGRLRLQIAVDALEDLKTLSENYIRPEPDERDWIPLGPGADVERHQMPSTLAEIRQEGRRLSHEPTGRAVWRTILKYAVGAGMRMTVHDVDQTLQQIIRTDWKRWKREQLIRGALPWRRREREIIKRLIIDGEAILRIFDGPDFALRFLEPEHIQSEPNGPSHGIETDPLDVETIKAIHWKPGREPARRVPYDEIVFWKIETYSTQKRGVSFLWDLRRNIKRYDSWIKYRMALNKARAAIVLLRKHSGATPSGIREFLRGVSDPSESPGARALDTRRETLRPGTIIDTTAGVDYEFAAPNIQATDVRHDGRAVLLQIAASSGLAEYMVTGDASNANYSSTLIAEGPAVKEFELWQADASDVLSQIAAAWRDWGIRRGRLPQEAGEAGFEFIGPRIVSRDDLKAAQANAIRVEHSTKSRRTWMEEDGLDPFDEERRIQEEGGGAYGP